MKTPNTIIIAGIGTIVVAVSVFLGVRAFEDSKTNAAKELNDKVNAKACETYMEFSYVNFKENMTRSDYVTNYQAMQVLATLGGDAEYLSLLDTIISEYEIALAGKKASPIGAMADLNEWCKPYLGD